MCEATRNCYSYHAGIRGEKAGGRGGDGGNAEKPGKSNLIMWR